MAGQDILQQQPLANHRSEDHASVYSNNVGFEQSVWDLKILFGELDQSAGVIEQHTAVTVPWSIAKISLYYLATQVAGYEIVNGKIPIPPSVVPLPPPALTDEQKGDPTLQRIHESFKRLHEQFLKNL